MAYSETKDVRMCTLVMDEEEAGYLLDLLYSHVGGRLTWDEEPLGRIRVALQEADVPRLAAHRVNDGHTFHAILQRNRITS